MAKVQNFQLTQFLGDLDLLGMMQDRDRAELRLILAKHKLLFLRPKYREEQMIEEVKGMFRLLL